MRNLSKKQNLGIGIFLLFAAGLYARDLPQTSAGSLRFIVDNALFRGQDGQSLCEFYFQIYADQLSVENQKTTFSIHLILTTQDGRPVAERAWQTESPEPKESAFPEQVIIPDIWRESLRPGNYNAEFKIRDLHSEKSGHAQLTFSVLEFGADGVTGSNIEFISKIADQSVNPLFEKNGRSLLPNVTRQYGVLKPLLAFYYELYNLQKLSADTARALYQIRSIDGNIRRAFPEKDIQIPGESAAILHAVPVADIKSGSYMLTAQVAVSGQEPVLVSQREFEVIQADYLNAESALTQEQADIQGKLLTYLASPEQLRLYERLDLAGKGRFLVNYWSERDPNPVTPENEYLLDIQKRFRYASETFAWAGIDGWRTDRGRVLIKYGFPDELERHHSEPERKPWERWIYLKDRRFEFIFVDVHSNGRFALIHSDHESEVHNPDWLKLVRVHR